MIFYVKPDEKRPRGSPALDELPMCELFLSFFRQESGDSDKNLKQLLQCRNMQLAFYAVSKKEGYFSLFHNVFVDFHPCAKYLITLNES